MQVVRGGGLPRYVLNNDYRIKISPRQTDGSLCLAISGLINAGNLDLFLSDLSGYSRQNRPLSLDLSDVFAVDENAAETFLTFAAATSSELVNAPLYLQQLFRYLSETK